MKKKILIVDDDPIIVKYLVSLFSNNGYETVSASTSKEAKEHLKALIPDLITLDLEMPEEWGSKFYREIRKNKDLKDIPIIVISALAGKHAVKDAVAFINKPFDSDKLLGIVKKTIG